MPITVQHSPNFNLLGGVAAQAGFGQYQQRQDQIDLETYFRQQALAQQQAQNQQRMQLAAQQQALDADARARQQLLEAGRLQAGWQQNQIENKFRNDQLDSQNDWRDQQIQDNALGRKHSLDLQNQANQNRFDLDMVNDAQRTIEGIRAETAKLNLTPEGKKILNDQMRDLRGIQSFRGQMSPAEYQKKLYEWLQKYEEAGVRNYVVETPTVDQTVQQNAIPQIDPITSQPTGGFWVRDAKGNLKLEFPPKAGAGKQQNSGIPLAHGATVPNTKPPAVGVPHDPLSMPSLEQKMANDAWFTKEVQEARNALKVEPKPAGPGNPNPPPGRTPTQKEIEQYIRDKHELQLRLTGKMGGAPTHGPTPQIATLTLAQEQQRNAYIRQQYAQIEQSNDPNKTQNLEILKSQLANSEKNLEKLQAGPIKGSASLPWQGVPQQPINGPAIDQGPSQFAPSVDWAERQISGQSVPQFMPETQPGAPGVPAPPVPQLPPQMAPPAEPPRTMLPKHKPAYDKIVAAVGSPDEVNEDALARAAQEAEMRAGARGELDGGQKFLEDMATKTARVKELVARKKKGEKLSEADERELATLGPEVRSYFKNKSK